MKYRIVSRNKSPHAGNTINCTYYYAQVNVFGVWIDCRYYPFFDDVWDAYDTNFDCVERWVKRQISIKEPMKEEVVKTYD